MMRICYIWWIICCEIYGASRHGLTWCSGVVSSCSSSRRGRTSCCLYLHCIIAGWRICKPRTMDTVSDETGCGRIFIFTTQIISSVLTHPSFSPYLMSSSHQNNKTCRLKEQHLSVSVITNPTRHVVVVVRHPITSKRRHALVVAIPRRRCVTSIGVKKPRVDALWVLVGWDTWRPWPVGLRMDLGRVHRRRRWLPARIEIDSLVDWDLV